MLGWTSGTLIVGISGKLSFAAHMISQRTIIIIFRSSKIQRCPSSCPPGRNVTSQESSRPRRELFLLENQQISNFIRKSYLSKWNKKILLNQRWRSSLMLNRPKRKKYRPPPHLLPSPMTWLKWRISKKIPRASSGTEDPFGSRVSDFSNLIHQFTPNTLL